MTVFAVALVKAVMLPADSDFTCLGHDGKCVRKTD